MERSSEKEEACFFVAIHIGAGYHSSSKEHQYRQLLRKALHEAERIFSGEIDAIAAVSKLIAFLEDSPLTNAGNGSNLTEEGFVETDASLMDGTLGCFGAVGALHGVQNPIQVAELILRENSRGLLPHGRVPPMFLVGSGAQQWAKRHGIEVHDDPELLITPDSRAAFEKYTRIIATGQEAAEIQSNAPFDTVGAICVDRKGRMAAGVSSGGLAMKSPGRVGEAALYGVGCWAQNASQTENGNPVPGIAVSCTGVGEEVTRAMLSSTIARELLKSEDSDEALKSVFDRFLVSSHDLWSHTASVGRTLRHSGAIIVKLAPRDGSRTAAEFLWAHTAASMGFGYLKENEKPKVLISRLDDEKAAGNTCVIGGIHVRL